MVFWDCDVRYIITDPKVIKDTEKKTFDFIYEHRYVGFVN